MLSQAVIVSTLAVAALAADPSVTIMLPEYKVQALNGASAVGVSNCKATYVVNMGIDAVPYKVPLTVTQASDNFIWTASKSKDKIGVDITGSCTLSDNTVAKCITTKKLTLGPVTSINSDSSSLKDKKFRDAMFTLGVTENSKVLSATSTCTGKSALALQTDDAKKGVTQTSSKNAGAAGVVVEKVVYKVVALPVVAAMGAALL